MKSGAKQLGIATLFMAAVMAVTPQQANADLVVDGWGNFSGGQSSQALVDAGVDKLELAGDVVAGSLTLTDSGNFGGGAFQFHQYEGTAPFDIDIYGNPLQYGNADTIIGNLSANDVELTVTQSNDIYSFRAAFDDANFTSFVSELDNVTAQQIIIGADDFTFEGAGDTSFEGFTQNLLADSLNIEGADFSFDFNDAQGSHNSNVRIIPGGEFNFNVSSVPEPSSMTLLAFAGGAFMLLPRRRREETAFTADGNTDSGYDFTPNT